jgi:hypothetical protein
LLTDRAKSPGLKILDPGGAFGPGKDGDVIACDGLFPSAPFDMGELRVALAVAIIFFQS